jgi:hypothetical protein
MPNNSINQPKIGVCRRCLGDILNKNGFWYHVRPQANVENPHYAELQP